jgi:hypothetical protein
VVYTPSPDELPVDPLEAAFQFLPSCQVITYATAEPWPELVVNHEPHIAVAECTGEDPIYPFLNLEMHPVKSCGITTRGTCQQTKGLQGYARNVWPRKDERETLYQSNF